MEDGLQVRKTPKRVCDIVAEYFENQAQGLPGSMKDEAANLRRQAAEWRKCSNPAYQKIITERDFTQTL